MRFRRDLVSIRGVDTAQHIVVKNIDEKGVTFENWDPNWPGHLPLLQTKSRREFEQMIRRDNYTTTTTTYGRN